MHMAELSMRIKWFNMCAIIKHNAWHLWARSEPESHASSFQPLAWSQRADLLREVGASWNESTPWRLHDFTSSEVFSWPYHPGNYLPFLNLGLS